MLQGPGPWQLGVWAQTFHALGTEPLTADDHLTKASWTRDSQDAPANSILLTYLLPWVPGPDHTPPWWRIPLMSIAEKLSPCLWSAQQTPCSPVPILFSNPTQEAASAQVISCPLPAHHQVPGPIPLTRDSV